MKRVIVTGATGFVGANLARRLVRDGHEVHLLVRPSHKAWRIDEIRSRIKLHELHLHDLAQVTRAVEQIKPEWIFHLAVHGGYSWQTDYAEIVQTNVLGTMNLVTACAKAGFEAFVNTGSSSEYGFKDHAPAESETVEPNSSYAVTKVASTMFCRHIAQSQKAHIPTLRLYSVYGSYEDPGRLIATVILRGLKGELPPLANPNIARDYIYVDDVVDAYLLAATVKTPELGAIYNVGSGVQTTIRDVITVAREQLKIAAEPAWGSMGDYKWDATIWVGDNRKLVSQLKWQPRHKFADGFRLTADWFRKGVLPVYTEAKK